MSVVTFFAWIDKNIKSVLKNPLFVEFVVGKSFKVGMEQFQIFWEIFSPVSADPEDPLPASGN